MASAADDLLAFKDYDDIAVNQPKKVINDGRKEKVMKFFVKLYFIIISSYCHV